MNLSKTPALYRQYTKQGISSMRVFATLVCLSNILPRDRHWNDFIDLIETLLVNRHLNLNYVCSNKDVCFYFK